MIRRNGQKIKRESGQVIFEELLRRGHVVHEYITRSENSISILFSAGYEKDFSIRKMVVNHTWPEDENFDIDSIEKAIIEGKNSFKSELVMHEALE